MKRLLFTLGLVTYFCALAAQSSAGANIKFDFNTYDYDTIEKGSDGYCTFTFRNVGSEPLVITSASSSCGCTTPEYSKKPVMPGKTGVVRVRYNTELVGSFRKTIVVKSNAANAPIKVLKVKGYVREKKRAKLRV